MTEIVKTVKVTVTDHSKLRRIRHEFEVDTFPEAISKLIEEHEAKTRKEAEAIKA